VNALRKHWSGDGYPRRPQLAVGRRRAAFKPGAPSGRASAASGCGRTGITCLRQLRRGIAPACSTAPGEVVSCPERPPCFALREKREICSLRRGCNVILPGQYYDAETGLSYNYMRDYDPATGRYVESDPIGLNGGINPYRYAYDSPLEYLDDFGLAACFQLICIAGFATDNVVSSTLVDPGKWSLINVHVDADRMLNSSPLANPGGIGDVVNAFRGAQVALCFFARTRTYREEHSVSREWHCLEVCTTCGGGQQLQWNSHVEINSYEKIRREREQQVSIRKCKRAQQCRLPHFDQRIQLLLEWFELDAARVTVF